MPMAYKDPERKKAVAREWYVANRDHHRAKVAVTRRERRHKITEHIDALKDVSCPDCGGKFPPECMDFDHVTEGKRGCISSMATSVTFDALLLEIAKCEVVCSNCHRIRTKLRRIQ